MDSEIVSAQEIFDVLNNLVKALDECASVVCKDSVKAMLDYADADDAARQMIKRFNKL